VFVARSVSWLYFFHRERLPKARKTTIRIVYVYDGLTIVYYLVVFFLMQLIQIIRPV